MAKKKAADRAKAAKKSASAKPPAKKKRRHPSNVTDRRSRESPSLGPLDVALMATYGGEAALGLVEYTHAPPTQPIANFLVHVQDVSARPIDPSLDGEWQRQIARQMFQAHDQSEQPFLRVIGRVLDELLNHRRYTSCSGGDVYLLLLEEIPHELPAEHRQDPTRRFNKSENPGRKTINNRLNELKGESRRKGASAWPAFAATTSTTAGGAERGYILTPAGHWLFDGWPELPELIPGR
jgi:hypothetical protein